MLFVYFGLNNFKSESGFVGSSYGTGVKKLIFSIESEANLIQPTFITGESSLASSSLNFKYFG